jgi:RNA-directed DNA polymerase
MRVKLAAIKAELRKRMHDRLRETGAWLQTVVRGYFQYHAIPGNTASLGVFRERLRRLWRHVIRRRGQKHRPNWKRLGPLLDRWLPQPCVLHPYPELRFDATHPR